MDKIFKIFEAQIKSVDHAAHTVEVIVSTGSVDRHMESVKPEAFKKRLSTYKAHPVLLSSHDYGDLRKQIGEAETVKVKDDALVAKFKYYVGEGNEEADWAFNLASKKVAAYSIGFMSHGYEDSKESYEAAKEKGTPLRTYTDVELVEISQVLIPSNRDAVQERAGHKENDLEMAASELCTKALGLDGLLTEISSTIDHASSHTSAPTIPATVTMTISDPDKELADMKAAVEKQVEAMRKELVEIIKGEVVAILKADKDMQKEIAQLVVDALKSEVNKNLLKDLIIDAVEEITADEFYRELLFGKVAQKSPQPTPSDFSEQLKQIARSI